MMDSKRIWEQTPPDKLWVGVNVVGTAVCFGWLGTLGTFRLDRHLLLWGLLTGLLWGSLQWLYLRQRPLTVSLLWPLATSLGWLLALPFLAGATDFIPTSQSAILATVADFINLGNPRLQLLVGYTVPISLLVFFGILAGMPLSLPQLGVLWLLPHTRTAVQSWFGNTVWGWTIGLAAGGLLLNLIVGFLPDTTALPRWFAFALLGSVTGAIYSFFHHFYLSTWPTETKS